MRGDGGGGGGGLYWPYLIEINEPRQVGKVGGGSVSKKMNTG